MVHFADGERIQQDPGGHEERWSGPRVIQRFFGGGVP